MAGNNFMEIALDEARAAAARGEVPVGAVIVRDGEVLAQAGNRTLADRDPTAHAEMLAIRAAAKALGTERLTDCDLYVTLEPCAMCAAAMSFARIRRLYYGAADPKGGAVDNGVRFFAAPTCHHRPEVYGGIGESEARHAAEGVLRGAALGLLASCANSHAFAASGRIMLGLGRREFADVAVPSRTRPMMPCRIAAMPEEIIGEIDRQMRARIEPGALRDTSST